MENAQNGSSLAVGKVKRKTEVIPEAQRDKRKVHFASKKSGVRTKISELCRTSRILRGHSERRLRILRRIY